MSKRANGQQYTWQQEGFSERYHRQRKQRYMRQKYGLSLERYEEMLLEQGNACLICQRSFEFVMSGSSPDIPRKPAVDHDHRTGDVRGILCTGCNSGLGQFEDSVEGLERAIRYLRGELRSRSKIVAADEIVQSPQQITH